MSPLSLNMIVAAFWGFLVGFVGWRPCFLLPEPMAKWLLQSENSKNISVGIARSVIMIFLIFFILIILSWVPILVAITHFNGEHIDADLWRNMYGISFVSSFVGLFVLGFLRK